MPDKRQHRGRHPEDNEAFAPDHRPRLRDAVHDLSWLLSHGYADKSALKLIGDRYNLRERQRTAVMRCACSDAALAARRDRQVSVENLAGHDLLIDGYNVLTTVEAAMAGGVILVGRDGCYRDMASMHGTFRGVTETIPAISLLGQTLVDCGVRGCTWYLDRPVSNSGRLKCTLLGAAAEHGWPWRVEIVADPDRVLAETDEIIATADSAVLDRCRRWFGLARVAVEQYVPDASVVSHADAVL